MSEQISSQAAVSVAPDSLSKGSLPQDAADNALDDVKSADPDELDEQVERFDNLSGLLSRVDGHVSQRYDALVDASDDDTDPPHTSDLAESKTELDHAYEIEEKARAILDKPQLTVQDVNELEGVLDELDKTIESATPLSFVDAPDD